MQRNVREMPSTLVIVVTARIVAEVNGQERDCVARPFEIRFDRFPRDRCIWRPLLQIRCERTVAIFKK